MTTQRKLESPTATKERACITVTKSVMDEARELGICRSTAAEKGIVAAIRRENRRKEEA